MKRSGNAFSYEFLKLFSLLLRFQQRSEVGAYRLCGRRVLPHREVLIEELGCRELFRFRGE